MDNINLNLGIWNSVFAVPCDVVDKHIKLAGAAQLKVLLWIFRNAGREFTPEEIGDALSMHPADVKDSIEFWVIAGLLSKNDNNLSPVKNDAAPCKDDEENILATDDKAENTAENKKPSRPVSRPQRPDPIFVAQRLTTDEALASLMQEAEVILGRPLSHGDSSTLLMMHDNDGLPVDVILMIMQYSVSQGKGMRYIEKLGIGWSSEGIDTLEKAEEKIRELTKSKEAWAIASKTFGIKNVGTPTKTQIEYSNRWINAWGYDTEMLREAYEKCVDTKGEYNLRYIDGIIKKWHKSGIMTKKDLQQAENAVKNKSQNNQGEKSKSSYDIDAYANFSIFDKKD